MNFDTQDSQNNLILDTNNNNLSSNLSNLETQDYGLNPIANESIEGESQLNPDSISDPTLVEPVETPLEGSSDTQQLVFIGSEVKDSQTIIDNISGASDVVLLDSSQDELVQISQHLNNYQDVDGVHIISHGEPGQLSFANTKLNQSTLPEYVHLLENWGNSLSSEADILIYGCDVASGEQGNELIKQISDVTDADVAASTDDTGVDGNWKLETAVGEIELVSSIVTPQMDENYQHNLYDAALDVFQGQVDSELSGGGSEDLSNESINNNSGDVNIGTNNDFDSDGEDKDDNGGNSDVYFTGAEFFSESFYLEQNPDVAEDDIYGTSPRRHYDEVGWKEGRDPNKIFDTSFYLEDNPDVAEDGANPFEHYHKNSNSDGITRYPNQEFKTIGTSSEGIIIASSDLSSVNIEAINSFAENLETENPEVAALPAAIPIIYVIAKGVAVTAISLELAKRVNNIQELVSESTTYTLTTDDGGIDSSIPPFDTGEVVRVELESFPNGDRFIENILDGQFEFPDGDVLFTDNFDTINSGESFSGDSVWDDVDAMNNPPLPDVSPEAEDIANNAHSFPKHKDEFPGVQTREDYAQEIDNIIKGASGDDVKTGLDNGRSAYWDDATGAVVIVDPKNPEGGSAFKPKEGRKYFEGLI